MRMPTTCRPQQRYDHRLRNLVCAPETCASPRSAASLGRRLADGWPRHRRSWSVSTWSTSRRLNSGGIGPSFVGVSLVLRLRRRVGTLAALLRLALALLHTSGFRLTGSRLPDGHAKSRILRGGSGPRVPAAAGRPAARSGAESDSGVAPAAARVRARRSGVLSAHLPASIGDMVTAGDYRHVPTATLAVLAQRLGTVCASPATWHSLVRRHGWRRPRLRVHPATPKVGVRTTRPDAGCLPAGCARAGHAQLAAMADNTATASLRTGLRPEPPAPSSDRTPDLVGENSRARPLNVVGDSSARQAKWVRLYPFQTRSRSHC